MGGGQGEVGDQYRQQSRQPSVNQQVVLLRKTHRTLNMGLVDRLSDIAQIIILLAL